MEKQYTQVQNWVVDSGRLGDLILWVSLFFEGFKFWKCKYVSSKCIYNVLYSIWSKIKRMVVLILVEFGIPEAQI